MNSRSLADLVGCRCVCEFSTDVGIFLEGHPHEVTVMAVEGPMLYLEPYFPRQDHWVNVSAIRWLKPLQPPTEAATAATENEEG